MKTASQIETLYLDGLEALTEERFEQALESFESIQISDMKDPVMLNDLALAMMAAGDKEKALSLFKGLAEEPSPHPFAIINHFYCREVLALSNQKEPEQAGTIKKIIRQENDKSPNLRVIMTT